MRLTTSLCSLGLATSLLFVTACGGDGETTNENEVITTVTLDFAPNGGGATVSAAFNDPDGDGGTAPTVDPIVLATGKTYAMTVRFQNKLETPPDEITDEVRDESDQHQVFVTGSAINGPATTTTTAPLTHSYADTDANGLPIGLSNTIVAAAGTGQLIVTLRHIPPVNDVAAKVAGLAEQIKTGGLAALPGDTDAQVTFSVTVQ
jgi:hypothetical protein